MGLFRSKKTQGTAIVISGHRSEWLVGTDHYPAVYARGREGSEVVVELVPETDNPHDPNAIAGHVDGKVAGHLNSRLAAKYRVPLVTANELGFRVLIQTEFRRRESGEMGMGWLDIPSPEALTRWLALPDAERSQGFDFAAGKSPATPRALGRVI